MCLHNYSLVYLGSYGRAKCTNNCVITTVTSSVAVFLLTSSIMWTIGFICGQPNCTPQCKLTSVRATHIDTRATDSLPQDTTLNEPVYADPHVQELGMIDNVAYVSTVTQSAKSEHLR